MLKNYFKKVVYSAFLLPITVFAQATVGSPTPPAGALNISSPSELAGPIANIISFFGSAVFAVSTFVFIYAGFLYVTAGDNEENINKAKSYLTYGIVGLVIALVAFSIPLILTNIIGVGSLG